MFKTPKTMPDFDDSLGYSIPILLIKIGILRMIFIAVVNRSCIRANIIQYRHCEQLIKNAQANAF